MSPWPTPLHGAMALAAGAALAGCSSCPPFRASWYLDEAPPKEGDPPGVYLALLHEGRKPVDLSQVVVNPQGGATLPFSQLSVNMPERPAGGMALLPPKPVPPVPPAEKEADDGPLPKRGTPFKAQPWLPGQLLVFRVRDATEKKQCSLPVMVQIECGGHCGRAQPVSGALPNYLHPAWIAHCSAKLETTP